MVYAKELSFSYGEKILYKDAHFMIGNNQKVGLVGLNGTGKSTLFSLLCGKEQLQYGFIEVKGSISLVPQEVKRDPAMEEAPTIRDYVDSKHTREDYEIYRLLSGLEYQNCDLEAAPQRLSGGQKTKLALAKALLSEPDVLLLDEPTNFMDVEGKKFVMDFLAHYKKTLILISHDIHLMDKAIDKVLYVNGQTKKIDEYNGNYTSFLRLKGESEELLKRTIKVKEKHIKHLKKAVEGMMGRKTEKGVRQRIQLQRRLEREKENLPEAPMTLRAIKIALPEPLAVSELPVRALGISKSYEDNVIFEDLDFTIRRRERIPLIGRNGAGKSTLLKILMGKISADQGQVIRASNLVLGYYSQEFETFNMEKSVMETFIDATNQDERYARAFLAKFMFFEEKLKQRVESLSGGEKTRLSIALITAKPSNLLVLDEPTTYLDALSQRVILEAVKQYKGTMIIVSHTPEFIAELNPERAFVMPENKFVYWDQSLIDEVSAV